MTALRELRPAAAADVFITEELDRRVPKRANYLREKLALQELAARMADRPQEVLPCFVDLALEMAGGVSAGLSLYEEHPAPACSAGIICAANLNRSRGRQPRATSARAG